ncbi:uncharacterized protein LOC113338389 isoform X2 [Papaver somniferum]|uniref:uncharacterized protein LOC113338389 isoform X2 n=1 Tax=Papaver somniferum TaxID=3469 RepID=UPI000E6FEA4C|nr:uncharacterized protein LOC113338389 isoform X2 [Papaver somniferum]XP_026439610.1 uncharacterized protein LOC113338389 isoform X2 [Papaver somniferum]XP_026439611.1 uncharacterized protein LOC113338389 isoform X2 [Papaver somniferum]
MNQLFLLVNGMIVMIISLIAMIRSKNQRYGEKIDMGIEDGASANQSSERRMSEGDVETMEEDISGATKSTNGNTSEEDMSTEMKDKKEKRKLQEDGVESEQNEYIETAIEVKKKNKSISTSDV